MDIPILKYVDIVIGLAVVILLVCTIVTAVTQMVLSMTYSKARYLRDGLEDLVRQIDPATLDKYAYYIAERCLRHPLVGRNNTPLGKVTSQIRNWFRWKQANHPLPGLNPPDVLQRDELVLMLLEWAANEGPLALQDQHLSGATPVPAAATVTAAVPAPAAAPAAAAAPAPAMAPTAVAASPIADQLNAVRTAIKTALVNNGIADPGAAARDIRAKIVNLETTNPDQASAISRSIAISSAAPSDFVGKIHVWFDNTMARISSQYGLLAQVWSAVLAFSVVFACQFDALDLIKRLAQDDKLRADLVQQARDQTARIDGAQRAAAAAKPNAAQQKEIDDATVQRQQITSSLAVLRDPNRTILPSYFLWQSLAQALVCFVNPSPAVGVPNPLKGNINVDADYREFQFDWDVTARDNLAVAVRSSGAPVSVYTEPDKPCLRLVAHDPNVGSIMVRMPSVTGLVSVDREWGVDWPGFRSRLGGMLVAAILVSLGVPFWYDLLKKLMGLRSVLANKDDADRKQRQDPQPSGS